MNPPDKLIEGLKKKNFLGADDSGFDTYAELEKSIVAHVFGNRKDDSSVVRFDAECIENANDYSHLIQQFIDAVPADLGVSDIESNYDAQAGTASCAIKLGDKLEEAEWAQDSDWVAAEFIEFMLRITVCSKGRFVVIDTGDQTFCAVFLTKGLSDALEKYRSKDSSSREAFISQHASGNLGLFEWVKILPRQVFKAAESNLRRHYNNDQELLDPEAYQTENMTSFMCVSETGDALSSYLEVTSKDNGFTRYVGISRYEYDSICPDETAYFLSLKDPEQEVVFEYPAKTAGRMVGEGKLFGPYALTGKASDWAIVVNEGNFICLGTPVIDLVGNRVADTRDNRVAKYYDRARIDCFEPLVSKLGYSEPGDKFRKMFLMKHGKHWSTVELRGSQGDVDSDLNIKVVFAVADPDIDYVASRKTLPEPSFDFDKESRYMTYSKFGEISWNIASEADYEKLAGEIEGKMKEMHREVAEEISSEKWLKIFADQEDNMRAAVAAYFLDDTEAMEEYILKQYEIETGPNGYWYNRDQVKKLADFLDVKIG